MILKELVPSRSLKVVGYTCDRCGIRSIPLDYSTPQCSPFRFEWNESEEDELLLNADICENCQEEILPALKDVIRSLRELIPNASVRASTMLDWEGTGEFAEAY